MGQCREKEGRKSAIAGSLFSVDTSEELVVEVPIQMEQSAPVREPEGCQTSSFYDMDKG